MHILISNCAGFINTFANSVGLERWGYKYYFVFVVWNVCASALWFLFAVETRGRTLEELDELFEICDRIAVIAGGRLSPLRPVAETSVEEIGQWMGGKWPGGADAA